MTPTAWEVINYLIAHHEGKKTPSLRIYDYIRAFSGEFDLSMPFTFYFMDENRPVLFVRDLNKPHERSGKEIFMAQCARMKSRILEITGIYEELSADGSVRRVHRGLGGRPELPEGYERSWRRYGDFYQDIMTGLGFVCLGDFVPQVKLYSLWNNRQKEIQSVEKILEKRRAS
jgi:hypothetical protein